MTGLTKYRPDGYDISFEHVTFAYRENEDVLKDVSFTAKQGQVTALVGHPAEEVHSRQVGGSILGSIRGHGAAGRRGRFHSGRRDTA